MKALPGLSVERLRLNAEMLVWRTGWLPFVAIALLLLGLGMLVLIVPAQQARLERLETQLAELSQTAAGRTAQAPQDPPQMVFQRTLLAQTQTNEVLRRIYQLARDCGVATVQADFRRINDNAGVASQLQIALPVRGDYLALRRFALSLLADTPALSLDQISFKREMVSSGQIEAQMILSVWQLPERKVSQGGQP